MIRQKQFRNDREEQCELNSLRRTKMLNEIIMQGCDNRPNPHSFKLY